MEMHVYVCVCECESVCESVCVTESVTLLGDFEDAEQSQSS